MDNLSTPWQGNVIIDSSIPFAQLHSSFGSPTFSVAFLQLFSCVPKPIIDMGINTVKYK